MAAEPIMVYINDELLINGCPVDSNYSVTSTGLRIMRNGNLKAEWTYSGSNQFLGFSTTQGATTAEYEVGSTGYLYDMQATYQGLRLYSVEMVSKLVDNIALSEFLTKSKQLFYYSSNPPPYPVTSVNGQSGAVTVTVPTKTSNLINDSGFTTNTGTITGVSVNGTSIATSGVANITSIPASILSGAIPSAVTATTQANSDNSTKIATTAFVKTAISGLIGPMMFKGTLGTGGTITTLPTAAEANTGFTYKVITDGTYASIAAKVGDLFISNGSAWIIVPSGDETFVPTLTSTSDGQGHVTLGVTVGPMVNGNTMSF